MAASAIIEMSLTALKLLALSLKMGFIVSCRTCPTVHDWERIAAFTSRLDENRRETMGTYQKCLTLLGASLGLLTMPVNPALANDILPPTVTVTCTGYTISLQACNLVAGTQYTIFWDFALTPSSGSAIPISGDLDFVAVTTTNGTSTCPNNTFSGVINETLSPPFPLAPSTYSLSGSALLENFNATGINFSPSTLTCPTPPVTVCASLGSASHYAVLGLQGSTINLSSGPLRINGNAGIGQNGQFNFSGGGQISGVLDADPTATINISGGGTTIAGGTVVVSMAAVQSAALAEASIAGSLTPTQTFSQITSSQTIVGNGGQNVIKVNGLIHLSGGALTISGGPNDTFIFQIAQGLQLDGGANIVLNGVTPSQVLFYFSGSGYQIQTSGNANTAGVFLAPNLPIQINGGTHNSEFISEQTLSYQSNPQVNQACP
jgi:hypothetical protein